MATDFAVNIWPNTLPIMAMMSAWNLTKIIAAIVSGINQVAFVQIAQVRN